METNFGTSVSEYMSKPALAVAPSDLLENVYARLLDAKVSSLAVVEDDALVGVVSRTDLLREGRLQTTTGPNVSVDARHVLLEFAPRPVSEIMTRDVAVVSATTSIAAACKMMCDRRVHRVLVTEDSRLLGVFSTFDVMVAIRNAGAQEPISDFMSKPIEVVDVEENVAKAVDQLELSQVSGLIAVDDEWPVGVFTQVEALAARDLDDTTLVEDAMDPALICMPVTTTMQRAAQQGLRMRVRRIVASENRHMRGILSGLDFARYAARDA